jgi:arginase
MSRTIRIIGVPIDLGANRRGVDMGPSAIRYGGLDAELSSADVETVDAGDIPIPRAEERDPDATPPQEGTAKFLREVEAASRDLADRVAETLEAGETPLALGGDHSVAIGTLAGSARDAEIGAVWLDAHGDFNTPTTSPSGNVHGMPLAAALGVGDFAEVDWANATGLDEANVAMVGLRDLDATERTAIRDSDVTAYTMSDLDERGVAEVVEEAVDVATDGTDGIHVSLDLDWLDPNAAPGVGTPVRGGATYREAHAAMETIAGSGAVRSVDVVEVNPIFDEHNETAELAGELAASVFGKRILG